MRYICVYIYIYIKDHFAIAEIDIILQINYTSIKIKKKRMLQAHKTVICNSKRALKGLLLGVALVLEDWIATQGSKVLFFIECFQMFTLSLMTGIIFFKAKIFSCS